MITEFLLTAASGIVSFFMGLAPADATEDMQGWTVEATNTIGPVLAGAGQLGAWLPWGALGIAFPVVLGIYILLFFLKAARNLFSHFPVIGGNG